MLAFHIGVNEKGKLAYFVPTRLKVFFRALVYDPSQNAAVDFMREEGDADFAWKTYRDRVGMGNVLYDSVAGIDGAPGFAQVCLEPGGFCDLNQRKNVNGGMGMDTMAPHSTQKKARDCTACHLDEGGGGAAKIGAVYGWNPQGYTKQTSAYLNTIDTVQTNHGTYTTTNGFVIADDGIQHRLDWLVDETTGYPLVSTIHVRSDDGQDGRPGRGYDTWDPEAAGPITKTLIDRLKHIRVRNAGQ
jgi:hypothetical protein